MNNATTTIENFTKKEVGNLNPRLVVMLQMVRYLSGQPICITSGMRPGDKGAHGDGDAVDISDNMTGSPVSSQWRHAVLAACYRAGFTRIGVYDRHIHVDVSKRLPQSVTWWAKSD